MNLKEIRTSFIQNLSKDFDKEEILSFFYLLSEKFIGLKRVDVAVNLDKELSLTEIDQFNKAEKRLINNEPLQYILGDTYFYGLCFKVNQNVLIPRPETEELVDWIIKNHKNSSKHLKILDIGTGSGCIAISLAKNLKNSEVFAMDISRKAIEMAKKNAKENKVSVTFILGDILETEELFQSFDVIVSNPPYVRELEKKEIKPNVLNNEPHQALFVSDSNPLVFYKKITKLARRYLIQNGMLYFEINQYLGAETLSMIETLGFDFVELRKDIYNKERMICARLN